MEEIEVILNEIDPYYTGVIQLFILQNYFSEEIRFNSKTNMDRPNQIFDEIRSYIFPNKKLALQQALVTVDKHGDNYIGLPEFILAFEQANVNVERDTLEFLFDMVSEKYNKVGQEVDQQDKVLSITYFIDKLFSTGE